MTLRRPAACPRPGETIPQAAFGCAAAFAWAAAFGRRASIAIKRPVVKDGEPFARIQPGAGDFKRLPFPVAF
jgi:hypothetical protein